MLLNKCCFLLPLPLLCVYMQLLFEQLWEIVCNLTCSLMLCACAHCFFFLLKITLSLFRSLSISLDFDEIFRLSFVIVGAFLYDFYWFCCFMHLSSNSLLLSFALVSVKRTLLFNISTCIAISILKCCTFVLAYMRVFFALIWLSLNGKRPMI